MTPKTLFTSAVLVAGLSAGGVHAATLTTTFNSNNGAAGNMFNIEIGPNAINLTDIAINLDILTETTVSFWFRLGSYVGFETSSDGWTLLDQAVLTGQGEGNPTPWDLTDQIFVADTTYGIFLHDNTSDVQYTNATGAPTAVFAENDDLAFFVGLGRGVNTVDPFAGDIFDGRGWNGTLNYDVLPAPSAVPLPAGGLLLLSGLAGVAGLRRRAKRRAG